MDKTKNLLERLYELQHSIIPHRAMIGFDGYVDLIQKAVKSTGPAGKVYFNSLSAWGEHIAAAAGRSAQVELRTLTTKLGGNAPIMANALGHLGIDNYCVGTMGQPDVNAVFREMHSRSTLLSIGQPAFTNALEFDDGKLILSDVKTFDELDLETILNKNGHTYLNKPLEESKLIAMVDWSNLPKCSALWRDLFEHIQSINLQDKIYFFDLCDPSKKTAADIREALQIIAAFKTIGKTILGLNENEAVKVYCALHGVDTHDPEKLETLAIGELESIVNHIFKSINVDVLLVHPVDRAIAVSADGLIEVRGRVVPQPKILTGGGDNLNAGFCFGLMNDLVLTDAMILGIATSGAYVQNGRSPDLSEVIQYIQDHLSY